MAGGLTALKLKTTKPTGKAFKLSDGGGLYFHMTARGSGSFRYDYRSSGKRRTLTIGKFPDLSLADARRLHQEARKDLANGIDPAEKKLTQRKAGGGNTFSEIAHEWFAVKGQAWSEKHKQRVRRAINFDLARPIGNQDISGITATDVLECLRRIERRGALDTAKKTKQIASQIFRYGVITGKCQRDPTSDLQGALTPQKKTHRAAITDPEGLSGLLKAVDQYSGSYVVKTATQFSILVFQRPGEIRRMEWEEVDLANATWSIPSNKMKSARDHIVPLSTQALSLLTNIQQLTGHGKYVFPSARGGSRPLSENGVRTALRTMGYTNEQVTPHGFRATARTLLDEKLGYSPDLIEHQLAHAVRDATGRAYNRTTHLQGRQEMMQGWADYLDSLRAPDDHASPLGETKDD